jgi:hypothetical protein
MDYQQFFLKYGWIAVIILCIILYKFILRVFFGMVIVPENRLGLVTKKFVLFGANKELPDGRIIATKAKQDFRLKPLLPACIGACGRGSTG